MNLKFNNENFSAMKKMILLALLTIVLCSAAVARELVAEGKTFSALGDYRIETADKQVVINGEELKTFVISYQNSPMEVTLVIKKGKNCKDYIVLSEKLTIQYVCNESYFGVQKLDKTLNIKGFMPTEASLNLGEYYHQKVLAPGRRGEVENAQLIAAYFPKLLASS